MTGQNGLIWLNKLKNIVPLMIHLSSVHSIVCSVSSMDRIEWIDPPFLHYYIKYESLVIRTQVLLSVSGPNMLTLLIILRVRPCTVN